MIDWWKEVDKAGKTFSGWVGIGLDIINRKLEAEEMKRRQLEALQQAADDGDSEAQAYWGAYLYKVEKEKEGDEKNYSLAEYWLKKSVENSYVEALDLLWEVQAEQEKIREKKRKDEELKRWRRKWWDSLTDEEKRREKIKEMFLIISYTLCVIVVMSLPFLAAFGYLDMPINWVRGQLDPNLPSNGYNYYIDEDDEAVIIKYLGLKRNVKIPAELDGKKVKRIGNSVFWKTKIKSAIIPEGVTSIGGSTFGWCRSLRNVKIPDSVIDIADNAFFWSMKNLTVICSRGSYAWNYCVANGINVQEE